MRNVLVFILIVFSSCQRDNSIVYTYSDGSVKKKYYTNGDGVLHGDYVEYNKNGNISVKTKFDNGRPIEQLRLFDEKSSLYAKGEITNTNFRKIGWWFEKDTIRDITFFREYVYNDKKQKVNQQIAINESKDTLYDISYFCKIKFKNRIEDGNNLGKILLHRPPSKDISYLSFALNGVKQDTFRSDKNEKTVYFQTPVIQTLNGKLIEKILEVRLSQSEDSLSTFSIGKKYIHIDHNLNDKDNTQWSIANNLELILD